MGYGINLMREPRQSSLNERVELRLVLSQITTGVTLRGAPLKFREWGD